MQSLNNGTMNRPIFWTKQFSINWISAINYQILPLFIVFISFLFSCSFYFHTAICQAAFRWHHWTPRLNVGLPCFLWHEIQARKTCLSKGSTMCDLFLSASSAHFNDSLCRSKVDTPLLCVSSANRSILLADKTLWAISKLLPKVPFKSSTMHTKRFSLI